MRVDGLKNTQWLLDHLSRSFAFKTAQPILAEAGSACCTFHMMYTSQMTRSALERLLAGIPEVNLISDPA
jgi:hypothetical protein